MNVLDKIRAWFRRRTEGATDPSQIDSDRQTAMARSTTMTSRLMPPSATQMWNLGASIRPSRLDCQSMIVTPAMAPQTPMEKSWSR